MSLLKIRKYPDPALRQKCQPVIQVTPEIKKLIEDMFETMYKNQGLGLAAPQVGVKKRVIVVNAEARPLSLINPKITKKEGREILKEGCLSFPGVSLPIKRASKIVVEGLDKKGKKVTLKATYLTARALQHEIDHLDGILIIDRIPFWKRRKLREKLEKKQ